MVFGTVKGNEVDTIVPRGKALNLKKVFKGRHYLVEKNKLSFKILET